MIKDIPGSIEEGKSWIDRQLRLIQVPVSTVLDIGCGYGTYYNYFNATIPNSKWTGVEIWEQYRDQYNLDSMYHELIMKDAFDVEYTEQYDVVFVGDVLEHMEKDRAVALIHKLMKNAKYLFISIPIIYYPCTEYEVNPYLTHVKPDWSHEEVMQEFGSYIKAYELGQTVGVYMLTPELNEQIRPIKTCAYTILKNELKYIETWLNYTKNFTYRCLLDTGSTDGSWEALQEAAKKDPNLIIEQRTFTPWKFDVARTYNLAMIPDDVDWCLSPDMDEYFSINVLKDMDTMLKNHPEVTNMSTTRLDLYSEVVFVGPPHQLPSNKIHRRHDYHWNSPIYEHLIWNHKDKQEVELHLPNVYLIHDQDYNKEERSPLYLKMLLDEYQENPNNCWTLWFLVNHYYKEKDLENFIMTGCDFVRYHTQFDEKYHSVLQELTNIYKFGNIQDEVLKQNLVTTLSGKSI